MKILFTSTFSIMNFKRFSVFPWFVSHFKIYSNFPKSSLIYLFNGRKNKQMETEFHLVWSVNIVREHLLSSPNTCFMHVYQKNFRKRWKNVLEICPKLLTWCTLVLLCTKLPSISQTHFSLSSFIQYVFHTHDVELSIDACLLDKKVN